METTCSASNAGRVGLVPADSFLPWVALANRQDVLDSNAPAAVLSNPASRLLHVQVPGDPLCLNASDPTAPVPTWEKLPLAEGSHKQKMGFTPKTALPMWDLPHTLPLIQAMRHPMQTDLSLSSAIAAALTAGDVTLVLRLALTGAAE